MEHLADEYGHIEIAIPKVTGYRHCPPIRSLDEFYAFPKKNGWSVGKDYALNENSNPKEPKRLDKPALLQSWLFFGLLSLVVQAGGGPVLTFEELLGGSYLDTKLLPKALATWEKFELKNRATANVRMVRTELALEYAQRVVRKNCAFDAEEPGRTQSDATEELDQDDTVPLALMVLGETLSAAKARILHGLGTKMRGWHRDDEGGWGPPRYVFRRMNERMWCPRTKNLLQGQLGSNATLLLAAFESQDNTLIPNDIHKKKSCTKDVCRVISGDEVAKNLFGQNSQDEPGSSYLPQHWRCRQSANCPLIGPNMEDVYSILRERNDNNESKKFPILKIIENPDQTLGVEVLAWSADGSTTFATISHVWSDGLGNEDRNKIYRCQLKFISTLLDKVARSTNDQRDIQTNPMPFWMDTLLIPVQGKKPVEATPENSMAGDVKEPNQGPEAVIPGDFDELKKRAIRQIYHVFDASEHSIIIDRGLLELDAKGRPWKNVMKILASGWMRRLWTLQEAYLSKSLWIAFKQHSGELAEGMEDFDKLIKKMVNKETLSSSFAEMAKLKLLQNIMGDERDMRKQGKDPRKSGGAMLIANTWRATRWRTTSNPAHETLALATLLNLDYRRTTINQAGLTSRNEPISTERLGTMMCDFWSALNRDWKGSIPPGIIFLPGEKLTERGFRWAPKTWMKAMEIDHPDPLNIINCTTDLAQDLGLCVEYPGFLLHCQDRKVILGTDHVHPTFTFPIDRDLLEWYTVEPADKEDEGTKTYLNRILDQPAYDSTDLAILLSRSRPREMPPEIGLLVEIYEKKEQWTETGREFTAYCCHVIHRVRVWRTQPKYGHGNSPTFSELGNLQRRDTESTNNGSPSILQAPSEIDAQICIGELIESNQRWYVDRSDPAKPEIAKEEEKLPETSALPTDSDAGFSTTPRSKNGGSVMEKIVRFRGLAIFWRNASSHQPFSDAVASPLQESSRTEEYVQDAVGAKAAYSGSSVDPAPGLLKKSLTGLAKLW